MLLTCHDSQASDHQRPGSKKRNIVGPADAAPADLPSDLAGASAAPGAKRRKAAKADAGAAIDDDAGCQAAGGAAVVGKAASQQQSPSRRSTRTVKPEVDDGPAASGAGGLFIPVFR